MDNSSDKRIYIIIAALLILLVTGYVNNRNLNRRIDSMESVIRMMNNDMNNQYHNITGSIVSQVRTLLSQEADVVKSYEFKYEDIDFDKGIADTNLEFLLKNKEDGTSIYVLVKGSDEDVWEEIECVKTGILAYSAPMDLSLKERYSFRFIEKGPDGGQKELYSNALIKDMYNEFYEQRTRFSGFGSSESKEEYIMDFDIVNNTFGFRDFGVKSVYCKVIYKDTVIFDDDVTGYNISNKEDLDRYNLDVASGRIEPSIKPKINTEITTDEENLQNMYFVVKLDKETLKNEFPDLFQTQNGFFSQQEFRSIITIEYISGDKIILE